MKKFLLSIIIFNVLVIVSSSSSLASNHESTLYNINKNGQTYGADIYDNTSGEEPDLIAAYGTDGKLGYIKAVDLESNVKTPEEAIKQQRKKKGPKIIPVYDKDGKTIISQFILNETKIDIN